MKHLDIFNHECTDCPLHKGANTVCVEGRGNINGKVLFLGEAPGGTEDREGYAFAGEAGDIFDMALEDAGVSQDMGYVFNVVNCRPPGNRDPEKEEIEACGQYLEKVIAAMPNLELIVPMGNIAKKVMGLKKGITKIAGVPQPGTFRGMTFTCLPNVHPAYLFRNPFWDDKFINIFKMIPTVLTGVDSGFVRINKGTAGMKFLRRMAQSTDSTPRAFDLETTGLNPRTGSVLMVSFYSRRTSKPTTCIIDTPVALYWLREFYRSASAKVCQNIAFEYGWGKEFLGREMNNPHADTMIMSKREDTSRPADLGTISASHVPEVTGFKVDSETAKKEGEHWWTMDQMILATRCALDSFATFKAFERMSKILGKAQMKTHVGRDVHIACFIHRVKTNGMHVNMKQLMKLDDGFAKDKQNAVRKAKKFGIDCNLGSYQQVGEKLKERKILTGRMSKDKKYQLTNEDSLLRLIEKYPHIEHILRPVLEYRSAIKNKGTYVKGILTRAYRDNLWDHKFILRGDLRWPGTESFRLACSGAPLLTNPKGVMRTIYDSRWEDGWILKADYSQLELRVLAALSQDKRMLEIFHNDEDIHANTQNKLFGKNVHDPDGSIRSRAKAVNFGVTYLGGPGMLRMQLRSWGIIVSVQQCTAWIKSYREEYPDAMAFMDALSAEVVETMEAWSSAYHMKRTFHVIKGKKEKDYAKEGANHPIQSPAAQVALDGGYLFEKDLDPSDCLVVDLPHDEIVADCRNWDVLTKQAVRLEDSMISAAKMQDWFDVPVKVDVEYGRSWGELKHFHKE